MSALGHDLRFTVTSADGSQVLDVNDVDQTTGLLVPDSNGIYWSAQSLDGWEAPSMRTSLLDLVGYDGIIVAQLEHQQRDLTATAGVALAPTEVARDAALDFLASTIDATENTGLVLVTVFDVNVAKHVYAFPTSHRVARVAPGYAWGSVPPGWYWPFQWEAALTAPDPIKYGASHTVASIPVQPSFATIANGGNYPSADAVVTITNAADGDWFTFTGPGPTNYSIGFSATYSAIPSSLTIQPGQRTCVVTATGAPGYPWISTAGSGPEWWTIPPGTWDISYHQAGGSSGGGSVTFHDAYV